MEEHQESRRTMTDGRESHATFWMMALAFLVLIGVSASSMYYSYEQRNTIDQLTTQASGMNATIGQLQSQLETTTAKLDQVSTAQAAAADAAKSGARATPAGTSRAEANRLKQFQSRLDDQQKQLQSTQDDVTKTRSDIEGDLSSTRDDLNGSIAKTHDELVTLEKRGERDYVEFDLNKSKQFKREGPVSLMLRNADVKHANLDLNVLVNDKEITKKKVNLYEPVWIYETDGGEPLQVVVNKIDKNSVHGYVSAPKYSAADLNPAPVTGMTPVPDSTPSNADSTGSVDIK